MKIYNFILLVLLTPPLFSSISVNWKTSAPILDESSTSGNPIAVNSGSDVLYFLFYSTDDTIDLPSPVSNEITWNGNIAENRGNDRLVATRRDDFIQDAATYNITQDWDTNPVSADGYVYSVVFNYDNVSLNTSPGNSSSWDISIPNSTYGWVSEMSGLIPFDTFTTATGFDTNEPGNWDGTGSVPTNAAVTDILFVIPEPSTLILLSISSMCLLGLYRLERGQP